MRRRTQERKHKRVAKSATKLDTQDLCELVGISNLTIEELLSYLSNIEVDRAAAWSAAPTEVAEGTSSGSGGPAPPDIPPASGEPEPAQGDEEPTHDEQVWAKHDSNEEYVCGMARAMLHVRNSCGY